MWTLGAYSSDLRSSLKVKEANVQVCSSERQRKYGFSGFIFKDIKGRVECLEDNVSVTLTIIYLYVYSFPFCSVDILISETSAQFISYVLRKDYIDEYIEYTVIVIQNLTPKASIFFCISDILLQHCSILQLKAVDLDVEF